MQSQWVLIFILFVSVVHAQIKDPFASPAEKTEYKKDFIYITIPLQHIYPDHAASWLKNKSGALSKVELVNAQYQQKALWFRIRPEHEKRIRELISKIDKQVNQIWLEARIVNVDEGYTKKLGLQLLSHKPASHVEYKGLQMNFPSINNDGLKFPIILAKLSGGVVLDLLLTALENEGHGKVVARPKLLVADGEEANIEAGERVPYHIQTEHGGTSLHFANAVLRLGVTAHVLADKRVLLELQVNQDKVGPLMVQGSPGITTQALRTKVIVAENNTVVLGGIYEEQSSQDNLKIPWIGSIPLIGKLFVNFEKKCNRKELMIFITPKILTE